MYTYYMPYDCDDGLLCNSVEWFSVDIHRWSHNEWKDLSNVLFLDWGGNEEQNKGSSDSCGNIKKYICADNIKAEHTSRVQHFGFMLIWEHSSLNVLFELEEVK